MTPWYERYFGADYWVYASDEYTPQRTTAEAEYLAAVIEESTDGRRVLDVGCGTGRHLVALARLGFEMTGVDVSQWALRRAAAAAAAAGVTVQLHQLDALTAVDWPVGGLDAVISVQAFGWGSDAQQLGLLRSLRGVLAPGGVLVLDHSSVSAILRRYTERSVATVDGHSFEFRRRYDALTGRSGGTLRVRRPDGESVEVPDNVRLYQPPEVAALLSRAGFEVVRADADFRRHAPVDLDTRYVQFVARSRAWPESALVGHREPVADGSLDLRWAPDEAPFASDALATAWRTATAGKAEQRQPVAADPACPAAVRRYDLADPYGARRSTPVLSEHCAVALDEAQVTVGAGATGLLRALATLAAGTTVLVEPAGHPELALAATEVGATVRAIELAPELVHAAGPVVTVLDRPGVTGELWSLARLGELADAATAAGGTVVVDETCASYLPPAESAVGLAARGTGLIVLRSLSKGYCCGGLRVGFAVASPDLAARVRAVCPPLAAAALSLEVALALLGQGDVLAGLRARVTEVRPQLEQLLAAHGLQPRSGDPRLPWVCLGQPSPASVGPEAQLGALGITGKRVPVAPGWPPLLRLSVPLSTQRWRAARAALARPGGPP